MSKQIADRKSADAELGSDRCCLPMFALSTPAFMVVPAKIGHRTQQQGGLRTELGQRVARCVLGDVLQVLTKLGGLQLLIRLLKDKLCC